MSVRARGEAWDMLASLHDVTVKAETPHSEVGHLLWRQSQLDLSMTIELAPLDLLACQRMVLDVLPGNVGPPQTWS